MAAIEQFARFEHLPILLEGESGTGKSYVARHAHLSSPRSRNVFHQVILSTLDDNIAASDLFGHLSGAYTDARQNRPGHFVTANGGTLFLDEIGKASPSVQRKLLHAVEHQEIWPVGADRAVRLNVRLVAASNIPLEELTQDGKFLPDLAARLTNFRVRLPALRDRREDIPDLVRQFIGIRAHIYGYTDAGPAVDESLMAALQRADWPYNLRQLDAVVQRLMMEARQDATLTLALCGGDLAYLRTASLEERSITPEVVRERMAALRSKAKVARALGVSRWTVYRYLEQSDSLSGDSVRSPRCEQRAD